jgi:hypothetical protein
MQDILIKADNFGVDWINVNLPFPCEIHFLRPRYDPSEFKKNDSFKVLFINSEPSPWCIPEEELKYVAEKFDLIIGKKEIESIKNITVLPFGGSFVIEAQAKEFGISNLLSMGNHGSLLPGHLFRIATSMRIIGLGSDIYEVYKSKYFDDHLNKINPQIYPFIASLKVYPFETKANIFKKTHNIAIENNSEYNYFTEKLIDCFRTFTVPIYWGCTNINEHFDTRGMILINNIEEINNIIKRITLDDYLEKIPYMIKNFEQSKKYWDVLEGMRLLILEKFNNT